LELYNKHELREKLEEFLIFGAYPEIITAKTKQEKITLLTELIDSYLLKDILALEKIKSSEILLSLI
jgi:predicted AAA+ superfamily ATPase